jgi:hypothetical protein
MRIVTIIAASGLLLLSASASAQSNPGAQSGPLGAWRGTSSNPGTGTGDMPGSSVGVPNVHQAGGMLKGAYGLDLSRRIADAQALVDAVARGRVLTDGDVRHIRNLMREDFVAWNKQFDLLPSAYRKQRDHWLVDADTLTPKAWAQQRLDWLNAQRDWILARGG